MDIVFSLFINFNLINNNLEKLLVQCFTSTEYHLLKCG